MSEQEREELRGIVRRLSGSSQKVRRANILLQADADGPAWTDKQIAQAYHCRSKTVENVRQRLVERGFRETLDGKRREAAPRQKVLDGKQEAKVIATRLGPPPSGYANWTLRLLARKVVELEIVESVSHQTVMRTLKKTE
ncbi:helix-turn-helix domain-containing protein [Kolteria novifilia]|uniref:helix-turn-helix domain-containing protein n=1 Tax=Kolteria novifilia TaxID=2527975 RepID=UPI003AF3E7F1